MTKKSTVPAQTSNTIEIHVDFWENVVTEVEIKQCEKAIRTLIENPTSHGLHVERLTNIPGRPLYSFRVNQNMRILFQLKKAGKGNILQILEVTDHYRHSRYINNRCNLQAAEGEFIAFNPTAEAVDVVDLQLMPPRAPQPTRVNHKKRRGAQQPPQKQTSPVIHLKFNPITLYQDFISLSEPQKKIITTICNSESLAHSLMGPPGAGKSAIGIGIIRTYLTEYIPENEPAGYAIFIAPTKELAQRMRHIFNATPSGPLTVSFLTYKDFLKQHVPGLDNRQCVGFEHFKAWWDSYLKRYRTDKLPALLYTLPPHDVYQAFKIISGQTKQAFLQMGEAYLPFSEGHDNACLFDAYATYLTALNDRSDIYDAALFIPTSPIEHHANLIIFDESQWASNAQIQTLATSVTITGTRIIFLGDTHQSISGEIPTEQMLKQNFYPLLGGLVWHQLDSSFRCPPQNIEMINQCISAKSLICGGLGSNKAQYTETKSKAPQRSNASNAIYWLEPSEPLDIGNSPEYAIITLTPFVDIARERFNTPLVFTPETIGGLDFPYIVLYRITDHKALTDVSRCLDEKLTKGQPPLLSRPKNYSEFHRLKPHVAVINQLILLLSRNTHSLYIYKPENPSLTNAFFDFITGESRKQALLPQEDKAEKSLDHDAWRHEQERLKAAGHETIVAAIEAKLNQDKIDRVETLAFPTSVTQKTLKDFFDTCKTLDQITLFSHIVTPTRNDFAKACFNGSKRLTFITYLNTHADITYLSTLLIKSFFILQKNKLTPSPIIEIFYDYLNTDWDRINKITDISPFFENIPGQEASIFEVLLSDHIGQKLLFLFIAHHLTFFDEVPPDIAISKSCQAISSPSIKKNFYTSNLGLRMLFHFASSSPIFMNTLITEITNKGAFFRFLTQENRGLYFLSQMIKSYDEIYELFKSRLFKIDPTLLTTQADGVQTLDASDFLIFSIVVNGSSIPLIKLPQKCYEQLPSNDALRRKISFGTNFIAIGENNKYCYHLGNNTCVQTRVPNLPVNCSTRPLTSYEYDFYYMPIMQSTTISTNEIYRILIELFKKENSEGTIHELLVQRVVYAKKRMSLLELIIADEEEHFIQQLIRENPKLAQKFSSQDFKTNNPKQPFLPCFVILNQAMYYNKALLSEDSFLSIIKDPYFKAQAQVQLSTAEGPFNLFVFFELLRARNSAFKAYTETFEVVPYDEKMSFYSCMKGCQKNYFHIKQRLLMQDMYSLEQFINNKAIIFYLKNHPIIAKRIFHDFLIQRTKIFLHTLQNLLIYPPFLSQTLADVFFSNTHEQEQSKMKNGTVETKELHSLAFFILSSSHNYKAYHQFIDVLLNINQVTHYISPNELFTPQFPHNSVSEITLLQLLLHDNDPSIVNKRMLAIFQIPNFFKQISLYPLRHDVKIWVKECIQWCNNHDMAYPEFFVDFINQQEQLDCTIEEEMLSSTPING